MDPGSRSGEVAASSVPAAPATSRTLWTRASLVWMLIVLAETGSGWVREVFIAPQIGALRARQLGVLVGSVMILLITWACARWMNLRNARAVWQVGAFWVALIVVFELAA
jgi:hypothetical protein